MSQSPARVLDEHAGNDEPATIGLMRLLMASASETEARHSLAEALLRAKIAIASERLQDLATLWSDHPGAFATVTSTLASMSDRAASAQRPNGIGDWARAFDRAVDRSAEASVAIYSFGSPDLLAAATNEVCEWMRAAGLLGPDRDGLDLGCGIGRFLQALAPHLRSIIGIDVSTRMVEVATARCAALPNVRALKGTGMGLNAIADESVDFILAADVFPYLVDVGDGLPEAHVLEFKRVVRPGGHAVIWNYAYDGSPADHIAAVRALAAAASLSVDVAGTRPLKLWDGTAFLLRKPG